MMGTKAAISVARCYTERQEVKKQERGRKKQAMQDLLVEQALDGTNTDRGGDTGPLIMTPRPSRK